MNAAVRESSQGQAVAARRVLGVAGLLFATGIMVGALVLPLINFGMAEASTTRNPCTPKTRHCSSNTAFLSVLAPILHVPTG